MRSSKSRSRSKANRPRSLGNIINRVFDSSGPEGKVRGTPQQIIEKYLILARDAHLSNDRVAAENFQQHAEHYTRLLGEAQRELAAEQEERQRQNQQNHNGNGNGNGQRDRDAGGNGAAPRPEWRDRSEQPRFDAPRHDVNRDANRGAGRGDGAGFAADGDVPADLIDFSSEGPALVDTPEAGDFAFAPRAQAHPRDMGLADDQPRLMPASGADYGLPLDLPEDGPVPRNQPREASGPRPSFSSQRAKPKADAQKGEGSKAKTAKPKSDRPKQTTAKPDLAAPVDAATDPVAAPFAGDAAE